MSVGTFLVCYESSDVKPGSPVLKLSLVVDTVNKMASGTATVTQATNPPLNETLHVSGPVVTMTVMPNITHFLLNLASPQLAGPQIKVPTVVSSDWAGGTSHVTLWTDTTRGTLAFETAVAKVACS